MNRIDPTKPIHPLRVRFPVPPVCTAHWEAADWRKWEEMNGIPEPLVIDGKWHAVGRNSDGELLYRREND